MTPAAATTDRMTQLLAECRDQPVVYDNVGTDLCPALGQVILNRMQLDRGARRTGSLNVGGWKSGEDFFAWADPAVQALRSAIADLIGQHPLIGWAMVNRAGSHHPRHQHRAAMLSGVFYVSPGSADAITPTVFECPCDGRPARPGERFEMEVDPHPGRLVLCHGETWHRVGTYPGTLPRITIAFDVRR